MRIKITRFSPINLAKYEREGVEKFFHTEKALLEEISHDIAETLYATEGSIIIECEETQ